MLDNFERVSTMNFGKGRSGHRDPPWTTHAAGSPLLGPRQHKPPPSLVGNKRQVLFQSGVYQCEISVTDHQTRFPSSVADAVAACTFSEQRSNVFLLVLDITRLLGIQPLFLFPQIPFSTALVRLGKARREH